VTITGNARLWLMLGAIGGFLGVCFGAFGAHALRSRLAPDLLAVYRTGVEYQFYHAFALLVVGLCALQRPIRAFDVAGACFAAGILLFSGSLYALALSGVRVFGAVTPVGGVLFLAGWISLAIGISRT
jgi:uncharacterized membrane protein YgdD (TMEM256/DUF423 family)